MSVHWCEHMETVSNEPPTALPTEHLSEAIENIEVNKMAKETHQSPHTPPPSRGNLSSHIRFIIKQA